MNCNIFAVLVTYSWDTTVRLILADSEDEAKQFIQKDYEQEVREDLSNKNCFTCTISEDGSEATIVNYRRNGDVDTTTWRIVDDIEYIGGMHGKN